MPTTDFPVFLSRGGNANVINRMKANSITRFYGTPKLAWTQLIIAEMLSLRASTQVITLVVGGTASDGTYQLTFSGGGLEDDVVVSATRDSGETSAQMAAELESAIQTARAGALADVVTNEVVNTATITITCLTKAAGVAPVSVAVSFPGSATGTLTYTYVGSITVVSTFARTPAVPHALPEHIWRKACTVNRRVAFAGATAVTVTVGDANDPDGLVTSTSLLSTGIVQTTGAAEFTPRYEAAFVPLIQITLASATPLNFERLTAGEFEVELHYLPVPQVV